MQYLYIHSNIIKRRIEITSEAHLEKYILKNWKKFFNFDYYATRLKISRRSIVDLVGVDDDYFYLIELKWRPVREKDKRQVKRYAKDFLHRKPIRTIIIGYNHKSEHLEVVLWNTFMSKI